MPRTRLGTPGVVARLMKGSSPVSEAREQKLAKTFVTLTDTLVNDYDPFELMVTLTEQAVALLDVTDAAVLLADAPGHERGLTVAAATSERARLLEEFAIAIDGGPCVECVRTGAAVTCEDFHDQTHRWPGFAAGAEEAGFRAGHALPMRCRAQVIGMLNLLHDDVHVLADHDRVLAQALADAATIGLLHQRAVADAQTLSTQLQQALDSRVIVEQAKGIVAAQGNLAPDDAFAVIRRYTRARGVRLNAVCDDLIAGRLDLTAIVQPSPSP